LVLVVNHQPIVRSAHGPEDCARVVLDHCLPAVQARMARTATSCMRLLAGILQFWTDARRTPLAWTPDR
jgi:hypothetical protein